MTSELHYFRRCYFKTAEALKLEHSHDVKIYLNAKRCHNSPLQLRVRAGAKVGEFLIHSDYTVYINRQLWYMYSGTVGEKRESLLAV